MDARRTLLVAMLFASACAGCRREAPTAAPADSGPLPAEASTSLATTTVAPVLQPATTLAVADADGIGAHLVDGTGQALYALAEDVGVATCKQACLQDWPALTVPVDQQPASTAPVDGALVGKLERDDGLLQATYAKHPLYPYARDSGPGEHNGHGVTDEYGHWSLVAPDGKPIATK